jgi:hypothetical protein
MCGEHGGRSVEGIDEWRHDDADETIHPVGGCGGPGNLGDHPGRVQRLEQ